MATLVKLEEAEERMRYILVGQQDFTRMSDEMKVIGRVIAAAMTIRDAAQVGDGICVESGTVTWRMLQFGGQNGVLISCVISHGPEPHQRHSYPITDTLPVEYLEDAHEALPLFVERVRSLFPTVDAALLRYALRGRVVIAHREAGTAD